MKKLYRNHLPHLTPLGGSFFITFCTKDSIPIHKNIGRKDMTFKKIDYQRGLFESQIDLTTKLIATIIKETLDKYNNHFYQMEYYCIMSNHVHMVIDTGFKINPEPLHKIMKYIKGGSAREINILLNRQGSFWQKESYDHLIRSEIELGLIGDYILQNPVVAGKVEKWQDWPHSFVNYR